jgi:peptidoglycan lytic transglycosylase G
MLMQLRDPMPFLVALMGVFVAVVLYTLAGRMGDTPDAIASDIAALPVAGASATGLSGETVEVEIPEGAGAEQIIALLLQAGVLTDSSSFDTLLAFSGVAPELQAGSYEFALGLPASEVILRLRQGGITTDLVRIPEGLRVEEVGAILVEAGIVTIEEWTEAVNAGPLHVALSEQPADASLLGYLLPASYAFREDTTAEAAIQAMLDAFVDQVTPALLAEAEASGLTLHEVLTLASIVEREAALAEEQPLVASAFLNRLEQGIALQADPAIQFLIATPESVEEFGWWKSGLEQTDLDTDSPYNVYLYPGLPPGPIANPGIAAIEAVIRPANTNFIFFVAAPECDGSHRFAATLEGHNQNVADFRASGCGEPEE